MEMGPRLKSQPTGFRSLGSNSRPLGTRRLVYQIYHGGSCIREYFLAHGIRVSEILPWIENLTSVILPRLSRFSSVHWLYWNSRTCPPSNVIGMLKYRHHVMSVSAYSGTSGAFLQYEIRYSVMVRKVRKTRIH